MFATVSTQPYLSIPMAIFVSFSGVGANIMKILQSSPMRENLLNQNGLCTDVGGVETTRCIYMTELQSSVESVSSALFLFEPLRRFPFQLRGSEENEGRGNEVEAHRSFRASA